MKKYIDSLLIGIGIASFITFLNAWEYFGTQNMLVSLAQGAVQGLIVAVVYGVKGLSQLLKVLIHASLSYLSATSLYFFTTWKLNFWYLTLSWIIIFILISIYFYFRDCKKTNELNLKLQELKKKQEREK